MIKDQLFKTNELHFDNWLFVPETFTGLSRNRSLLATVVQRLDGAVQNTDKSLSIGQMLPRPIELFSRIERCSNDCPK